MAGFGAAIIFARWPAAEMGLRIAGAAFLIWLGAGSLRRAAGPRASGTNASDTRPVEGSIAAAYRQGLTVNLLNPAITSFYLVVLPSFIPAVAPAWYYAALAAAHVGLAFICHASWTFAFNWLRKELDRPAFARGLDAVTGLVLIALAIQVMTSA